MKLLKRIVVFAVVFMACQPASGGTSILDIRRAALDAYGSQDWERAAAAYSEWAALTPTNGPVWNDLGYCYMRLGRYDEAAQAWERAIPTGWRPELCYYNLACTHALDGDADLAMDMLEKAYHAGFVNDELLNSDADLSSLHHEPRFRQIVGWPSETVTARQAKWERDLGFIERRVREVHWRPFHNISESEFDASLAAIREAIDESTDVQLRIMIQALLVRIGDGHTSIISDFFLLHHGSDGEVEPKFLPLELFWFDDEVRVIAAAKGFEHLAGAVVTGIGGTPVEDVIAGMDAYVARDNEWGARWGTMQALTDPYRLEGLGYGDAQGGFPMDFVLRDGKRQTATIPVGGADFLNRVRVDEVLEAEPSLFYTDKQKPLWLKALDEVLYVRIDRISDGGRHGESFSDFTERIFEVAEKEKSKVLVIDMRDNLGGQGHLTRPLLHRLIASEFNREDGLYVIVGRKTFSAAMALTAQIELNTKAWFVGEPTGSRPNFVGESSIITLPYSRISLSISSRYHQNGFSNDKRLWIAPDIPAAPDYDQIVSGRDPAMEAILELVQ